MAVQPGLCQIGAETPKTGFLITRLICQSLDSCELPTYELKSFEDFVIHVGTGQSTSLLDICGAMTISHIFYWTIKAQL